MSEKTGNLSGALCERLASLEFEDLPTSTVSIATRVLLDAYGVMLGASGLAKEPRPFVAVALAQGSGPCSVVGTGRTASPSLAALANGALAHALDYEDAFDIVPGHPNASLVPALVALAQAEGPISGSAFLTALVAGCDVSCRIALALRKPMEARGWYPPPITAGLGAAVGAARLLGLDSAHMRDALSLMLCQVTMPGEIKHSPGTVIRAVREGFPAQAAVTSALLAREGVPGFEEPLEGEGGFYALYADGEFEPADLLDGLGDRFWIEQLTFKPWPSCRGTHPFIEMALELRAKHGVTPKDIAAVQIEIDDLQAMLTEPAGRKQAPQTPIDAKFSIPFCVAVALTQGQVGLDDFAAETLGDPLLHHLARLVQPTRCPAPAWQTGSGGSMRLVLKDGTQLSASIDRALGCPERPLPEADLIAKFVDCAGRAKCRIGPDQASGLARSILTLETCKDVGALLRN